MADTPSFLVVKDGGNVTRSLGTTKDHAGLQYTQHVPRVDGVPVGANWPMPVRQAGSTGVDYSGANPAPIPMPGLTLLAIIPATPARAFCEVQNQSAGTLQLVRDDGAGLNQSSILVASGGAAGSQGGGWSSATFKGRISIYGAAGAQFCAYQD